MKEVRNNNKKIFIKKLDFYDEVNKKLSNLNYNCRYIGTKLLIECIFDIYIREKTYNINLNREIYPILSKKYNKNIVNIKCSINYATTMMYYDTSELDISKFFGFKIIGKPKSKDIMIEVLRKMISE